MFWLKLKTRKHTIYLATLFTRVQSKKAKFNISFIVRILATKKRINKTNFMLKMLEDFTFESRAEMNSTKFEF